MSNTQKTSKNVNLNKMQINREVSKYTQPLKCDKKLGIYQQQCGKYPQKSTKGGKYC